MSNKCSASFDRVSLAQRVPAPGRATPPLHGRPLARVRAVGVGASENPSGNRHPKKREVRRRRRRPGARHTQPAPRGAPGSAGEGPRAAAYGRGFQRLFGPCPAAAVNASSSPRRCADALMRRCADAPMRRGSIPRRRAASPPFRVSSLSVQCCRATRPPSRGWPSRNGVCGSRAPASWGALTGASVRSHAARARSRPTAPAARGPRLPPRLPITARRGPRPAGGARPRETPPAPRWLPRLCGRRGTRRPAAQRSCRRKRHVAQPMSRAPNAARVVSWEATAGAEAPSRSTARITSTT